MQYLRFATDTDVEMELDVQTMSYLNYELLIEWPWQWDLVMSLVMSQRHAGFPGEMNTPSPGSTRWRVSELALGTVAVLERHSK